MSVVIEYDAIRETRMDYIFRAVDLIGDGALFAQQVAQTEVRKRSHALEASIQVESAEGGLQREVFTDSHYAIYNEFGTGIYAEGQSRAEEIPWVYYDEYLGQFFTTYGMRPQPFMRPAAEEAREWLRSNAQRYFG